MSSRERRWCPECDCNVLAVRREKKSGEDTLKACIFLFSCGLAFPVLVIMELMNNPWLCPSCGRANLPKPQYDNARERRKRHRREDQQDEEEDRRDRRRRRRDDDDDDERDDPPRQPGYYRR